MKGRANREGNSGQRYKISGKIQAVKGFLYVMLAMMTSHCFVSGSQLWEVLQFGKLLAVSFLLFAELMWVAFRHPFKF